MNALRKKPRPRTASEIKEAIRAEAKQAGFDAVGFASAVENPSDRDALRRFLKLGRHGDMDWMATTAARRESATALWPEARTVIALGLSYAPGRDPLAVLSRTDRGAISVYAQGRDYHDVLKSRLKALARRIAENEACDVKVFVDTAPVMEKPLAGRAGIGWQGKHTNLLSKEFGSWLFLGEVFTTLDLPPDTPEADHCGTCDRCRAACPTEALPEPYRIEPRRCISYLTIEHKGDIDPALMARMGNRIYGCDDCLAVCPWNKFAPPPTHDVFLPRTELGNPRLADLAELDDTSFRELFAGSPIKRTGRDRFVRNVLIAIGNSGNPLLAAAAIKLRDDPAAVVRNAAKWALERLGVS